MADGFEAAIGVAVDPRDHVAYVSDLFGKIWVIPAPEKKQVKRALV
ncbi:MAG: hypothetical protein NTU93_12470 [Arthrobacter sp.]|nr:hypothetical protein [Arthrobacter sp.]